MRTAQGSSWAPADFSRPRLPRSKESSYVSRLTFTALHLRPAAKDIALKSKPAAAYDFLRVLALSGRALAESVCSILILVTELLPVSWSTVVDLSRTCVPRSRPPAL